jgi:hypothetical protein
LAHLLDRIVVAASPPEARAAAKMALDATLNVFGSNAFDVTLLVLADALSRDGTLLAHAETP